jgi:hypothetical protein
MNTQCIPRTRTDDVAFTLSVDLDFCAVNPGSTELQEDMGDERSGTWISQKGFSKSQDDMN